MAAEWHGIGFILLSRALVDVSQANSLWAIALSAFFFNAALVANLLVGT